MTGLAAALGVGPGDMVAFTGAGGKTSAMFRLAAELSAAGRRVVVATTTHIREPLLNQARVLLLEQDEDALLAALSGALDRFRVVAIGPGMLEPESDDPYRKLKPISVGLADRIQRSGIADHLLVEADGARGRSLKAPTEYEPVVPPAAGIVVSVAAVDAVGSKLTAGLAHRPELIARVTAVAADAVVTPGIVARLITSPFGGLKGCPAGARFIPLINKVETPAGWTTGLSIAHQALASPRVDRVVLGAMGDAKGCVRALVRHAVEVVPGVSPGKVAAIVLAGGASRRFGAAKQLADVGGQALLTKVVRTVLGSLADQVLVVLGCGADEIAHRLGGLPVKIVANDGWDEGIASSVRVGVNAIGNTVAAALFVLGDQALLTTADINAVVGAYRQSRGTQLEGAGCDGSAPLAERPTVVVPTFDGSAGNPVLFDRCLFPALLSLEGDSGGRSVVLAHAEKVLEIDAPTVGVCADVDRPEDLEALRASGLI
jgi:molybdenum cofactor cytidylyltransferase